MIFSILSLIFKAYYKRRRIAIEFNKERKTQEYLNMLLTDTNDYRTFINEHIIFSKPIRSIFRDNEFDEAVITYADDSIERINCDDETYNELVNEAESHIDLWKVKTEIKS